MYILLHNTSDNKSLLKFKYTELSVLDVHIKLNMLYIKIN